MDLAKELDWLEGLIEGKFDLGETRNRALKVVEELRKIVPGPYKITINPEVEKSLKDDNERMFGGTLKERLISGRLTLRPEKDVTCSSIVGLRLDCKLMSYDPASIKDAKETFEENKELLEKLAQGDRDAVEKSNE